MSGSWTTVTYTTLAIFHYTEGSKLNAGSPIHVIKITE